MSAEIAMTSLPYRATTRTGDVFDLTFPLHPDTGSAVRVDQLLTLILNTLDRDISAMGETSNGDVLQALAMAIAGARAHDSRAGGTDRASVRLLGLRRARRGGGRGAPGASVGDRVTRYSAAFGTSAPGGVDKLAIAASKAPGPTAMPIRRSTVSTAAKDPRIIGSLMSPM
jgi:hypothetical protein